jgi:hypothetical protein
MRIRFIVAILFAGFTFWEHSAEAGPITIIGNAKACFGVGCTPSDAASILLSGVTVSYSSSTTLDFAGVANPDLAITPADVTGNFGAISVSSSTGTFALISSPFTLALSFANPLMSDVIFQGNVDGILTTVGTFVIDLNGGVPGIDATASGLAFVDPRGNQSGTMNVTAFGISMPGVSRRDITGLIETQAVPTPVPEPTTLLLLAGGIASFGARRYRERGSC